MATDRLDFDEARLLVGRMFTSWPGRTISEATVLVFAEELARHPRAVGVEAVERLRREPDPPSFAVLEAELRELERERHPALEAGEVEEGVPMTDEAREALAALRRERAARALEVDAPVKLSPARGRIPASHDVGRLPVPDGDGYACEVCGARYEEVEIPELGRVRFEHPTEVEL